jgi:3'-phosphoadenosine 5'-phosphosulfate sulfotransferase (PAPS reductase)/FAD synthetase
MGEIEGTGPELVEWDWILVNSSAGKDSQATLDVVVEKATAAGVLDRVVVVHCDLGRVEWEGTVALAQEQAEAYGLRFEIVRRSQGDLLDHIEARGMFPGATTRYCTSDHKTSQVAVLLTALAKESREAGVEGRVKILNILGLRAAESSKRSKLVSYKEDLRASNKTRREVWTWLPIFEWTVEEVWARIEEAGTRHHPAYDLGLPRLSCVFCPLAGRDALLLAGIHNPDLLAQYVAVEKKICHDFKHGEPISEIQDAIARGEKPGKIKTWEA